MSRTSFIEYKSTSIALYDFSGIQSDEIALEIIESAWGFLSDHDPKSVLTLTDVTGSSASFKVGHALFKLARENRPLVKAAAIVGADRSSKVLTELVTGITRRKFGMFADLDEAKDWLVGQAKAE